MKRSLMRPTAALFPLALLIAALFGNAAAVAELFQKQLKIDDNFSIPLCVGAVLFLVSELM